jgi:hypothetical protein
MPATPWLQPADPASEYLKGLQIGASIAHENARLSQESARMTMEAQARQETARRESLMEQQRIDVTKAYQEAQAGLKKQQLQQAAQVNAQKTHAAAMLMAEEHAFAGDIAGGLPVEQAWLRHPGVNPARAIAAHKDTLDVQQKTLDERAREFEARQTKPVEIGEESTTGPSKENPDLTTTTRRKIFGQPQVAPAVEKPATKKAKRYRYLKSGELEPIAENAD